MFRRSARFALAILILTCLLPGLLSCAHKSATDQIRLVELKKIWDKAPHNAFTDLIRYENEWFCTFREGQTHWSEGATGDIRVLKSDDGETWESAAMISGEGDLRDPKLSVTPDNQLMLIYFRRFNPHRWPDQDEQQFAQFSEDGGQWSEPIKIGLSDKWLWRVTWQEGKAYGITQGGIEGAPPFTAPRSGLLLVSNNGRDFKKLAEAEDGGESTIRFAADGTGYCLRRAADNEAYWGRSLAPYREWEWKKMNVKVGGPEFTILPDGRMLAAVRLYDGKTRTSLCWIDPNEATLTEVLELPSGGDTSYAGIVQHEGLLWISYYASHEGQSAIYLAKVHPGG